MMKKKMFNFKILYTQIRNDRNEYSKKQIQIEDEIVNL